MRAILERAKTDGQLGRAMQLLIDERGRGSVIRSETAEAARAAFQRVDSPARRRQLGQFMTPRPIAKLAAAISIAVADNRVVDPSCGDGAFLWAAADRLRALGSKRPHVDGLDIDAAAAFLANIPPAGIRPTAGVHAESGDTFAELTGLGKRQLIGKGTHDVILGNPPYVRYQSIAALVERLSPRLVRAFGREFGPSKAIDGLIRASLVAHLVDGTGSPTTFARNARRLLAQPREGDDLTADWIALVKGYSGLSDLSVPMWLIAWPVLREGGKIAYVTTGNAMRRNYGRDLRYFMLRFLRPLVIIEQEGNSWFGAQVPTSLMVFERRDAASAAVPLSARGTDSTFNHMRIRRTVNLASANGQIEIATRQALPGSDAAASIAQWAMNGAATESELVQLRPVREMSLIHELFADDLTAAGRRGRRCSITSIDRSARSTPVDTGSRPPALILEALVGVGEIRPLAQLATYGVEVHQGLRTGCNEFFYLRRLSPQDWAALRAKTGVAARLKDDLLSLPATRAAVARQLLRVPDLFSESELSEPSELLALSRTFDSKLVVVPTRIIRDVVKSQRDLPASVELSADASTHVALLVGHSARPSDLAKLSQLPSSWQRRWRREGLRPLPRQLADYVDAAERVEVAGVRIPDLSAVATNEGRLPAVATAGDAVPPPPTWWYTLRPKPRHVGHAFLPRVSAAAPIARVNRRPEPALIDANFSTFLLDAGARITPAGLTFLLNSSWCRAAMEATATRLGGGALKVEAAHLRALPVPPPTPGLIDGLNKLRNRSDDTARVEADRLMATELIPDAPAEMVTRLLTALADHLSTTRQRSQPASAA